MQRNLCNGLELRRRLRDLEPGPHGAFGVVLVGLRISETGEHAVARVLGDEAAVRLNPASATLVIGRDDFAHVLRIKPRGKRGRANEIDEHHCQLPALGDVLDDGHGSRRFPVRTERGNRPQHSLAVAEQCDADILQLLIGQAA